MRAHITFAFSFHDTYSVVEKSTNDLRARTRQCEPPYTFSRTYDAYVIVRVIDRISRRTFSPTPPATVS